MSILNVNSNGHGSFSFQPLNGHMMDWCEVLKDIALFDPTYMPHMIMYQAQYFSEKDEYYQEYSSVFYRENRPVGIWPVCVYKRNGKYALGTNGAACAFPLIVDSWRGTKVHRKMSDYYLQFLSSLCDKYQISGFEMQTNFLLYKADIVYEKLIQSKAATQYAQHELYVDLRQGRDYIWKGLRKRSRTQITTSKKALTSEIVDASSPWLESTVEQFRKLHISVSGRETRSEKTWKIQELTVQNAGGFIVLLKNSFSELIGALLVTSTPTIAHASVAAYKRELFDKYAMGHVCEMAAIERLCALGKQWYYIGRMPLPQDDPPPTDKEISIGSYKKGFCTDLTIANKIIVTPEILGSALSTN